MSMEKKKVIRFFFPILYWIEWIDSQSMYSPDFSDLKFNDETKLYEESN